MANLSSILAIKSVPQLLVEGATLAGIDIGAKDAADKYARAQAALQVAAIFTSLSSGDVTGALNAGYQELVAKVTDPGQAKLITDVFNAGAVFVQAAAAANTALPLLNAEWKGVATEVAAGITAVASQYKAA